MQNQIALCPNFCLVWLLLLTPTVVTAQDNSQQAVSALGRLEPDGGIIRVAAPSTPQAISGSILAELHVSEGDYVNKGDLLAIFSAGAYGFTMASNYNTRPRPVEVLVDGAEFRIIRRRETIDDLLSAERKLSE